jgi:predicted phosphoadenosine phosphosulfate sulfurtransferase
MNTIQRINDYIKKWKERGYPDDIPDEVPSELSELGLAPSYKDIALAILNNDMYMTRLGYSAPVSEWYGHYKRIEIEQRNKTKTMG